MPQPKFQYLSASNTYQARLIALGNAGLPWIVECTDDGAEPEYEGFADEASAQNRAAELRRTTGWTHDVFRLERDADGDWFTTYRPI